MLWTDLSHLTRAVLLMIGALLPVVNPLGDAPVFLAMTPGCDELTRLTSPDASPFTRFFCSWEQCCSARSFS